MTTLEFSAAFENVLSDAMRDLALGVGGNGGGGGKRVEGRNLLELRGVECNGRPLLPSSRVHGSSLFSRGETQSLCVATVGASSRTTL